MEMIDKYRELAINISTGYDIDYCINRAQQLLEEDFKEQIIELWEWELERQYNAKDRRNVIKECTKFEFVCINRYDEKKEDFISKNWEKLDFIIETLRDYIKEIEEKEENKENE